MRITVKLSEKDSRLLSILQRGEPEKYIDLLQLMITKMGQLPFDNPELTNELTEAGISLQSAKDRLHKLIKIYHCNL